MDQTDKFAEALWNNLDDFGFPTETDSYKFAFLREMPYPPNIEPLSLFKNYVQSKQFPVQKTREDQSVPFTRGDIQLCDEIVRASERIEWSEDDVNSILDRLVEWWDADKEYLKADDRPSPFGSIADEFKARFARLVDVLRAVITPDYKPRAKNNRKEKLRRLVDELWRLRNPCASSAERLSSPVPRMERRMFSRESKTG